MISFKLLLKLNKRIGVIFAREDGFDLWLLSNAAGDTCDCRFIPFPYDKSSSPNVPKIRKWILVIPAYQCVVRYAVLPCGEPKEIEKMLDFEITNITPYHRQQWTWDYSVVGQQADGSSHIFIVLSPLSLVEGQIETLMAIGIRPELVVTSATFDSILLNAGSESLPSCAVGCFSFYKDYMDFFVAENGQVTFQRGVRLKKKSFTDAKLVEVEIRRSLSMVEKHRFVNFPKRFCVIDSNASAGGLAKLVEQSLGLPVAEIQFNHLLKGHRRSVIRVLTTLSSSGLPAVGQKIRANLLPRRLKEKHNKGRKRKRVAMYVFQVGLVLILAVLSLKVGIWRNGRILQRYEQRLFNIGPMAEKLQFLQQQLAIIKSQLQGNISSLDIISELYRVLPKDMTVHYFCIEQNKKVTIRAQAKLLSEAFDCIGTLEQSDYFANVTQTYANQRQIQNSVLIDFEIVADLQKSRRENEG